MSQIIYRWLPTPCIIHPASCIIFLIILLTSCTHTTPQTNLPGWSEIYRRPGWSGSAIVDLRAVGDVMLARYIDQLTTRDGVDAPFALTSDLLDGDLTLGNLESPLTSRRDTVRPGPYRLLANPAMAPALASAGFDILSLANNHGLDGGPAGLTDSLTALNAAGVTPIGIGNSQEAALSPAILSVNGLRIAVLAVNDVADPADGPITLAAADATNWENPDFASCATGCIAGRAWLSSAAIEAVAAAHKQADIVVVLVHWGVEYTSEPSARQRGWAERLVAAGANLVVGTHPHVTQPAEIVTGGDHTGFVAYSLGNFVFDGPADSTLNSGIALRVLLDHNGVAMVSRRDAPVGRLDAPVKQHDTPTPQQDRSTPTPGSITMWRWNGTTGHTLATPAGFRVPPQPTQLSIDLRGNGQPLWARLDTTGGVTLTDGSSSDAPVVWTNESSRWRFTHIASGDPNDDGRAELILLLWQQDTTGQLRSQPYLLGWRGGRYQIIWGGSATPTPIQDLAVADMDHDGRSELVVLEGGQNPGDAGETVSVWHWHGWGFQREWSAPTGRWHSLALADIDHNGQIEIIAVP